MSETEKVQEAIELYFDSMYESSEEKVRKVFHPSAKITGFMRGKLLEQSVDQFAAFVIDNPLTIHLEKRKRVDKDYSNVSISDLGYSSLSRNIHRESF